MIVATVNRSSFKRSARIAVVLLVILNVLDVFSTTRSIAAGNVESNPIVAMFVHNTFLFWAIKIIVPVALAFYVWTQKDRISTLLIFSLWSCVGMYMLVVLNNFIIV
jgi:hypothetical protein